MKIGLIGAGNMGSAILQAIRSDINIRAEDLWVSRRHWSAPVSTIFEDVHRTTKNRTAAEQCDVIILAVKPQQAESVIEEIQSDLHGRFIISVMAGWNYDRLAQSLPDDSRFLMAMPNTPMMVGEGMILISDHARCKDEEMQLAVRLFEGGGKVKIVDDAYFTAANIVSGCGPAYAYLFIEALADGCVEHGVPRALAYQLAAQMLVGSGKMVLEQGVHPGALKDAVCSPNGTTIAGIHALESGAFRAAVMDAVSASFDRHIKLEHMGTKS